MFSGDPISGAGWVDTSANDKRMLLSLGPIGMHPNDTQEVVAAIVVGHGDSPLASVTSLRENVFAAKVYFARALGYNFACGDVDASLTLGVADAVYLINYIFRKGPKPIGGRADVNCDGRVGFADIVFLVNALYRDGPVPCSACD